MGLVAACLLGALYDEHGGFGGADEALQRAAAYYRLRRANFGVDASRAAGGMSPEMDERSADSARSR